MRLLLPWQFHSCRRIACVSFSLGSFIPVETHRMRLLSLVTLFKPDGGSAETHAMRLSPPAPSPAAFRLYRLLKAPPRPPGEGRGEGVADCFQPLPTRATQRHICYLNRIRSVANPSPLPLSRGRGVSHLSFSPPTPPTPPTPPVPSPDQNRLPPAKILWQALISLHPSDRLSPPGFLTAAQGKPMKLLTSFSHQNLGTLHAVRLISDN
jgi:hypothetical protein